MTTKIDGYGLSQIYVNNKLAHNMNWETNYDGDNLNVALSTQDNNNNKNNYFIELSNQDIFDLLNKPASNKSLESRLLEDFDLSPALAGKHHHPKHHKHHKHRRHSKKMIHKRNKKSHASKKSYHKGNKHHFTNKKTKKNLKLKKKITRKLSR